MTRVGLIFGGRSVEHLVSVNSARTVHEGLLDAGFSVVPLGVSEDGRFLSPAKSQEILDTNTAVVASPGGTLASSFAHLLAARIDVAFPIIHGTFGEDGTLQGLLDMLDIPYVGASVATSALCMDKLLCKNALSAAGFPVVEHAVIRRHTFRKDAAAQLARFNTATFPLFVKPAVGGSSVGCRAVKDCAALSDAIAFALRFDDTVLVERAVLGRELEVAVLGHEILSASAVGEIVPGAEFYDYADKYKNDVAGLIAPAQLDDNVAERIKKMAVDAFAAVQGSGMARVDFFLETVRDQENGPGDDGNGRLFINEINTLPGFTKISMYPRLWHVSGKELGELCGDLVAAAQARASTRKESFAAIASFVAENM